MTIQKISRSQILSFSFLALPLAFVGIPIYLNISDFYARKFDIDLATIGFLLIFIRVIDAVQDPFIGYFSDSLSQKGISHKKIIYIASSFLCLSFYLVFNPPALLNQGLSIIWFIIFLTTTYSCFNFVVINFESLAAIIAKNDQERIAINSSKEMLGVVGMIFAFLLPTSFIYFFHLDPNSLYLVLSLVFVGLMLVATFGFFRKVKAENIILTKISTFRLKFFEILQDRKFLFFLGIFLLNSVAVSLPAANLNFYIRDVLQKEESLGLFLSLYFISACLFIPLWKYLSNKFGMVRSWILSISFSVITFFFAYFINANNAHYFYLVCLFSGACLGADLITPPAMLAKIIANKKEMTSSYFSLWNLIAKLGLMIAASSSLIFLGMSGYKPGFSAGSSINHISFVYAILPCILKVVTIFNLTFFTKKFPNL